MRAKEQHTDLRELKKTALDLHKEINPDGHLSIEKTYDSFAKELESIFGLLPMDVQESFMEIPEPCMENGIATLKYSSIPGAPKNIERLLNQVGLEYFTRRLFKVESPTTNFNYMKELRKRKKLFSDILGVCQILRFGNPKNTMGMIIDLGGIWSVHEKSNIPLGSLMMMLGHHYDALQFRINYSHVLVKNNSSYSNKIIDRHQIDISNNEPNIFDIELLSKLQQENVIHIEGKRMGVDSLQVHYKVGEKNFDNKDEVLCKNFLDAFKFSNMNDMDIYDISDFTIKTYRHIELNGKIKDILS